ncbi:MAG TPA: hypothetical protein DCP53_09495 [Elusimicrobia bacterium]|nr:hypothetical protein [Elusimicrobiota bacterium]
MKLLIYFILHPEDHACKGAPKGADEWSSGRIPLRGILKQKIPRVFNPWSFILTFNFLLFTCLSSQQLPERILTLEESSRLAISNSQQLLSAEQDINIAKQRLNEARSILYPQLEFNTNYSRFEAESPLLLNSILGNTILPQKSNNISEIESYYTTKLSLMQIVWNGNRLGTTRKFAEAELKAAESDYATVKNRAVSSSKKMFYKLLAIQKKLEICNSVKKLYIEKKGINISIKDKFITERIIEKIGTINEEIENDREVAKIDFLNAIGIEFNTIFVIKGDLEYKKATADLNKCLAWAMEYRSELKKIELQEQMDALSVNLSLSGRYPIVAIGGNYQLEDTKWPFEKKSWNATVSMTLPIFDGFGQFARIKQRKFQYRKAQVNRASISDSIKAEVRRAYTNYEYAIKLYEQKSKDIESINKFEKEELKKLTYLDYMETLKYIMDSQLEYIDTVRNVIIAKIELENATGRSIE